MEFFYILFPTIVGAIITIITTRIWQINTMRRKIRIELIEEFMNYYQHPTVIFGANLEIIQQYYWKINLSSNVKTKKLKTHFGGEWNNTKLPREKFPEIGIKIMKETFMERVSPRLFVLINLYVGKNLKLN